jgi:hypothetical protein
MKSGLARVREIAKKLPNVEEGTTFGFPAFKVKKKLFAWFPQKAEVEPGTLGVKVSMLERDFRVQHEPKLFYFTPHYKDYPCVLVRVDKMSDKALQELLESGYEFTMSSLKRPAKPKRA